MTVTLKPLARTDLPRVAELERLLFAGEDPWTVSMLESELDWGNEYFGAHAGDELIGYAGMSLAGRAPDFEANVHTIGVDPAWQGRGIGRLLLAALLARADEVCAPTFLEVRTDNDAAIALYEANGFTKIGLRRKYYQPSGADAYTMARPANALAGDSSA